VSILCTAATHHLVRSGAKRIRCGSPSAYLLPPFRCIPGSMVAAWKIGSGTTISLRLDLTLDDALGKLGEEAKWAIVHITRPNTFVQYNWSSLTFSPCHILTNSYTSSIMDNRTVNHEDIHQLHEVCANPSATFRELSFHHVRACNMPRWYWTHAKTSRGCSRASNCIHQFK
jgi:hypothetical protein